MNVREMPQCLLVTTSMFECTRNATQCLLVTTSMVECTWKATQCLLVTTSMFECTRNATQSLLVTTSMFECTRNATQCLLVTTVWMYVKCHTVSTSDDVNTSLTLFSFNNCFTTWFLKSYMLKYFNKRWVVT